MADPSLDLQEQVTRIDRAIAETAKFAAEQRKLTAAAAKLDRERWWFPWLQLVTTVGGSAAIGAIVGRFVH